nr:class I SAM-dependent methyltransferase [Bacteroidales bacterium]
MVKIYLKPGREESLLRYHPWVFSGAVAQIVGNPAEGDLVGVFSAKGDFMAYGHYQIGSIAVRVLSFEEDPTKAGFWETMLSRALALRVACGLHGGTSTNCYRLVHGEGDGLPGLIIDYYDGVCVMQAHSAGMFRAKGAIADALVKVYGGTLKAVYDKSSGTAPFKAGLDLVDGYLYRAPGFEADEAVVLENGHKFLVNWCEGQKTGFFLDQRDNRRRVGELAGGRTVLNLFCYTGGFS